MRLLLLCELLIFGALSGPLLASHDDRPPLELTPGALELPDGRKVRVERGWLRVPEHRGDPSSRMLELPVGVIRSNADSPGPPIVYLAGGPGGSAIALISSASTFQVVADWLELGDVVLMDQRGCGRTRPPLAPPDELPLADTLLLDRGHFVAALVDRSRRFAEHLRAQGASLAGYTDGESAQDLEALRRALGVEKVRLVGFSYGTHLGLEVIRRYGSSIAAAVLLGVEGPDHNRKLPANYDTHIKRVSALVRSELGEKVDFESLVQRALARLSDQPMRVEVRLGGKEAKQFLVGPFGLQLVLVMDVGDTRDVIVLPRLLQTIIDGESSMLAWFVTKRMRQLESMPAVFDLVDGSAGASAARSTLIAKQAGSACLGNAMNLAFPEVMQAWGVAEAGAEARAPVISDVPTLFVSGTLDSNTPSTQAAEVKAGFARGHHLDVENAGHEDLLPNEHVRRAILRFLRSGETSDAITLPPPKFVPVTGPVDASVHAALSHAGK